jgi:group I intron endonuclease
MIIYKISNRINLKAYIGQTRKKLKYRWHEHSHRPNNSYFGRAIKKYGIGCWKLEVLEMISSIELLNEREIYWIAYYNTYYNGYNMTTGGDQPVEQKKRTEEQNRANSKRQKGMKRPRKQKHSPRALEYRLAQSIRQTGKKLRPRTSEEKLIQSIIQTGLKHRPWTEEERSTLSKASKSMKIIVCPYCKKEGKANLMQRWHFNNCQSQEGCTI